MPPRSPLPLLSAPSDARTARRKEMTARSDERGADGLSMDDAAPRAR